MISPEAVRVVRATLPVVGAAIDDITVAFYRRLFAAHPALERDLFNRANQAQGDQQKALAGAIAVYATLLVAEDGPDPRAVLARIGNKHASLGVTEDLYPVVHDHLFAAIVEILGEAVTPEVASAWEEVYWDMADALIEVERALYADAGVAPGDVWRTLVVRSRGHQSTDTVSFVLATPDGSPLPDWEPGQYVSVAVVLPDGSRQIRQYSLTHTNDGDSLRISVKAVPAAVAAPAGEVSNFLIDRVMEGAELQVSLPFGELTLSEGDGPLILISAGIGVTPMLGFLHHLRRTASPRRIDVLHADRSPVAHSHRAELIDLVGALPSASLRRWYENPAGAEIGDLVYAGRIDLTGFEVPDGADVYLCGPLPFMGAVRTALLDKGVPAERIRYEVFGPGPELKLAQAA